MSLIHEIHNQRPLIRHLMFAGAVIIVLSIVGFMTFQSVQQDIFFAMHPSASDQQAFLAERDANLPNPVATISKAAGSFLADIGSLIGWKMGAGFDRGGQQNSIHSDDGVHLLPIASPYTSPLSQ